MRIGDRVVHLGRQDYSEYPCDENGTSVDDLHKGTIIELWYKGHENFCRVRWDDGRISHFSDDEDNELPGLHELHAVTPLLFVNVYLYDRRYGGPEEGGWYYDSYSPVMEGDDVDAPICKMCATIEEANQRYEEVKAWCAEENKTRRPPHSVLSEGHFIVRQEAYPAEYEPDEKPTYS